ncbi:bifunctional riboflavin kinase/FAD synthetase [Paenibacillus sp. MZ03-122A]|uniref:bifunctional riboflavin kinase/FAD synthetase n=1 Tax=Paenibacillus sp. MZ03-122A TaxID=2962033 RepID=UPI0020B8883C|nr:bifunctional riboflavin kinase/FAD synthetase [Paenibacillus sp. MZ03-122A]MCP3777458.1 bifunctional riboflavin kinase/FAD synthetase [Paenibacillus sp. MZ03-122A]
MITVSLSYPLSDELLQQWGRPQVTAIGQFDGLHLGHASVIRKAVTLAREQQVPVSVMTFHPHPKEVMKKGDYEGYLTPLPDKQAILADMGVDVLYILSFNEEFSKVSPEAFMSDVLLPLHIRTAVVGFDFRFGHRGAGHEDTLRKLGGELMSVHTVPPFELDGDKVSSSGIRRALQTGDLAHASRWLGRPYRIQGTVMDGEKRGRTIGFPTANLKLDDTYVIPIKGVYAVRALVGDRWINGVMNVGVKPTFHEGVLNPSFEVHLFDFNQQIYGESVLVELHHYIRPERKFSSVDELINQIGNDAQTAKKLLG